MSDGKNLYFFITPSYGRPPEDQISDGITGIYYSNNKKGEWQEPERVLLDKKTGSSLDGCHFIDENIIWFCSARKGNYGEIDIYTARMENCKWTD